MPLLRLWLSAVGSLIIGSGMSCFDAAAAQSITLAWNANSEPDLAGYRLYHGVAPRVYTLHVPVPIPEVASDTVSAPVTDLQPGLTYYFAVTALTQDGLESGYSEEVTYTVPNRVLPPVTTESLVVTEVVPDAGPPPTETEEIVEVGEGPLPEEEDTVLTPSSLAGPRLEIVPVGRPVVAYFLSFEAPANRECELQVSDDLISWQRWVPFTTGAASRRFVFTDLAGIAPLRFYRLMVN